MPAAAQKSLPGWRDGDIILVMVNDEVFALLLAQVEETKKAHIEARERFWAVAGTPRELPRLPTGRPIPDGSELMRKAVAEETFAQRMHIEAMMRLNRYLLDGTVPDDVRARAGEKKPKSASHG